MSLMPALGCLPFPVRSESAEQTLAPLGRGVQAEEGLTGAPSGSDETLPAPHRLNEQPAPPEARLGDPDDESAHGLSLEAAIERLVAVNTELAGKWQDIPKARADIVTAGLRNDPVLFLTASPIPYGRFSAQRPGATTYDVTLVQALDVSGKRRTNKQVAEKNVPVLEAQYQAAVRLAIDRLCTVYVNVLEARAAVRAAYDNLQHLAEAVSTCGEQVRQGRRSPSDHRRVSIRQATARIALRRAEATLLHARRNLSVLLAIPAEEADHLRLCGSLQDTASSPPPTEELIRIARQVRPDLLALQRSVERAFAEVRREKAEAMDDLFLFFSPYQLLDSTPQGLQVGNSWQVGLMVPIPALNRNQGEIARARTEVVQWRSEVERAEQGIIDEVRRDGVCGFTRGSRAIRARHSDRRSPSL
jgi:cobalt-zinc-cadmium efflux system outer membrane protein